LHKTLIKGVLSHHDTRPGGAWSPDGQDANTGGIWGEVRLAPAMRAWLDAPRVTTLAIGERSAELEVSAEITPLGPGPATVSWQLIAPGGAEVGAGTWTGRGPMKVRAAVAAPEL
jgi:beta-mannosidase